MKQFFPMWNKMSRNSKIANAAIGIVATMRFTFMS